MPDTYNGWKNHATWQVGLFLRGDYASFAPNGREDEVRRFARIGAARLRDYVFDQLQPDESRRYGYAETGVALFRMDLFTNALEDVDWDGLATAFAAE